MLMTVYCNDPNCAAYKEHVKYTLVLLRRSRAFSACGATMVDGTRLNDDDYKNRRKRLVRKEGKYTTTRLKRRPKATATKRRIKR